MADTSECHRELHVDFTTPNLVDIVAAGNSLAQQAGGLDEALFRSQGHEFRKHTDQYQYVVDQDQWIPALEDEMKEVLRIGANASYS